MDSIIDSRYRKYFYAIALGLILLMAIARVSDIPLLSAPNPQALDLWYSTLTNTIGALITTIFIALFFQWIYPRERKHHTEIVSGKKAIGTKLKHLRTDASLWKFSGGTGSYTNSCTLPELSYQSKQTGKTISIQLVLLNPEYVELCQNYAEYRANVRTGVQGLTWTIADVRIRVLATIYLALKEHSTNAHFKVELALKNHFSTFRLDLSDKGLIMTKEDPESPAMYIDNHHYLYESYRSEIEKEYEQAVKVPVAKFSKLENPTKESVTNVNKALFPKLNLTDEEIERLLALVTNPSNAYVNHGVEK